MAVFITRWRKNTDMRALLALWLLCLGVAASPVRADTIEVRQARLEAQDEGWAARAELGLELSQRLEEAVNRGVPLYFNFEFELSRPRWYWLDEKTAQAVQTYKLSYHALTQTYRLSAGSLYQGFPALKEALRLLARPRVFAVERQKVAPGENYVAQVRMRLDVAQLPKAFQINALTSREWTLESEWKKFPFRADQDAASAAPAPAAPGLTVSPATSPTSPTPSAPSGDAPSGGGQK
jgi:hypothetical protein